MPSGLIVLQSHVGLSDPHVVNDNPESLNILHSLFESLVRRTETFFEPWLAESWTVTDDAANWDFKLRAGVTFHNGATMTPEAVVSSIDRARATDVGGVLGTEGLLHSYLKDARLRILDKDTIRVELAQPMADLLDLVSDIPILSPVASEHDIMETPSGSGPYRLEDLTDGKTVMVAFEHYWRERQFTFPTVIWRAEPGAEQRVARLCKGDADLIMNVPFKMTETIASAEGAWLISNPSNVCTVFMCNIFSGVCTDGRVRQALNLGFDHGALIDLLPAVSATPLNGPLTAKHFGYDPSLEPYTYAPCEARHLLAQAGFGQGMILTLDIPTILPDEAKTIAEFLGEQYTRIGVETRIVEHRDRTGYAQSVKNKNIHDACCFDSSPISTFRSLREKFRSDIQGPWWLGFDDDSLNQVLAQAQATVDMKRRESLYQKAHRLLRGQAPWIYLYNQMEHWGVSSNLTGWEPTVHGLVSFV